VRCFAELGVSPGRRNIPERIKDKGPLMQAGVRKRKPRIRLDQIAVSQEVEIEHTRLIRHRALASEPGLYFLHQCQNGRWAKISGNDSYRIDKPRLIASRNGRCLVPRRPCLNGYAPRLQIGQSRLASFTGATRNAREIRANSDEDHLCNTCGTSRVHCAKALARQTAGA
jgi:hypothetical protein